MWRQERSGDRTTKSNHDNPDTVLPRKNLQLHIQRHRSHLRRQTIQGNPTRRNPEYCHQLMTSNPTYEKTNASIQITQTSSTPSSRQLQNATLPQEWRRFTSSWSECHY